MFLALSLSEVAFIMLINVKMPTILHCWHLNTNEHDKFYAQHEKSSITSAPGCFIVVVFLM